MGSPTQQKESIGCDAEMSSRQLAEWVEDARQRTFELIEDLTDEQLHQLRTLRRFESMVS
jgi:type II secretory pathway predicted ATPase ExeA